MVVIVDGGTVVKQFGVVESAFGYAESMMKKRHDVWVVSNKVARLLEFI
jgi:hypothetical protein